MTVTNTYLLDGLCCANCAAKMEEAINKIDGVQAASVDFISKKLTLRADSKLLSGKILKETRYIVDRIEPGTKVSEFDVEAENGGETTDANKLKLIKLIIGGLLFASGLLLKLPQPAELAIFMASWLIVGGEIIWKALKNIVRGSVFDENFLMGIATAGAFFVGEYPEGAAVMIFFEIGEYFQNIAVNRSRRSIGALMDIRPDFANLRSGDELIKVAPEKVNIGDIILIKPGEKIPLDGVVTEGSSSVNTSALTGEAVPKDVEAGDQVLSGCINLNSVLSVEVTKTYSESTVAKILDLVRNASSRKAKAENFITKFAKYYTPAVVAGALVLAIVPPLLIRGAGFSEWIYRALVFLVISCPCALVVSIPLSFFGGIGGASRRGVLVKGGNFLEALNNVSTVVFDKTGTLTKGVFEVSEICQRGNISGQKLLELAAYAECYSNHPIALSILKAYGGDPDKSAIENYEELSGHGIRARVNGNDLLVGNSKLMKRENISTEGPEPVGTAVHAALNGSYIGYIMISDEIKDDAAAAVRALKQLGVERIVMLTGDARSIADATARKLGIDDVYAELLPADKVEIVEKLQSEISTGRRLAFVGDGINDAPVLARADIGIAMGGLGSDAAIEAADIVIMTDEPSKVATAMRTASKTRLIIQQNIVFALGIKLAIMALGAFGAATMWEAVFADAGVAVIAVLNSMRAMKTGKF